MSMGANPTIFYTAPHKMRNATRGIGVGGGAQTSTHQLNVAIEETMRQDIQMGFLNPYVKVRVNPSCPGKG